MKPQLIDDDVAQDTSVLDRLARLERQFAQNIYLEPIPPNTSGGWVSSAFVSRVGRQVVLQGSFSKTGGTPVGGDVMGVLPAWAWPLVALNPPVVTQNSDVVGTILIQTNGDIIWRTGSVAETDHTSVDGIPFIVGG